MPWDICSNRIHQDNPKPGKPTLGWSPVVGLFFHDYNRIHQDNPKPGKPTLGWSSVVGLFFHDYMIGCNRIAFHFNFHIDILYFDGINF
jgi:hypothetical protein